MIAATKSLVHAAGEHRFTVTVEDQQAVLDYVRDGDTMVITHTVVPPAIGGRGIAAQLVEGAFAWAREQHLKVRPECSYAAAYAAKHPGLADLLE